MPATVPSIERPRLLMRLADARLGVVVAGSGHGKSTFAEQAAADAGVTTLSLDLTGVATGAAPVVGVLRRAVRGAGMGALDAALEVVADGTDEAHLAAAAAGALCDELAIRHDPGGRRCDGGQAAGARRGAPSRGHDPATSGNRGTSPGRQPTTRRAGRRRRTWRSMHG